MQSATRTKSSSIEALAQAAVEEIARCTAAAGRIQRWYRTRIQWRHFSRVLKPSLSRLQSAVRTRLVRRRYLAMLETRKPWKDMLRSNEAIVMTCPVVKTSDVRGARNLAKVASAAANVSSSSGIMLLKSLLTSKKQRQLILTTGEVGSDSCPPPRLFYVDPVSRTWKGEIPFDMEKIAALTLTEKEFIVYSKQNEDKLDKEPIWSFLCTEGKAIDWIQAIRMPLSTSDLVLQSRPAPTPTLARATRRRDVVQINKLRTPSLPSSSSMLQGPLLMRQLVGPKKYFQHHFLLKGTTLYWTNPGLIPSSFEDEERDPSYVLGITLTAFCRVRLLETPRLLPNLPNCAFWLYTSLRSKPLKFRTMDLETAQRWVEHIGMAIAKCEMQSRYDKADIVGLAEKVLVQGKTLFEERSFLNAKLKFKDALDVCQSQTQRSQHRDVIEFECLEFRSRCNFMLGLYEKALDDCDAALSLKPLDESCLRTRAACLERLNRLTESLAEYERLLRDFESTSQDLIEVRNRVRLSLDRLNSSMETLIGNERKKQSNAATQASIAAVMKRPAIARQNSEEFHSKITRSGVLFYGKQTSSPSTPLTSEVFALGSNLPGIVARRRRQFGDQPAVRTTSTPSPTHNNVSVSSSFSSPSAEYRRMSLKSLMTVTSDGVSSTSDSPLTSPSSFAAMAEADLATTISRNLSFRGRFEMSSPRSGH